MTRLIEEDLNELKAFIANYSLENSQKDEDFNKKLKAIHKKYLSLLTFWAELEHQLSDGKIELSGQEINTNSREFLLIKESISDLGGAVFCWINGAYKLSEMSARSAIENLIRGTSSVEDNSILNEKRVFEIFEKAKKTNMMNGLNEKTFNHLKSLYGELCKATHTATELNMDKISCMRHFPNFDAKKSESAAKKIGDASTLTLTLLCHIMPQVFRQAHHRNRENMSELLKKDTKLFLAGAEV